MMQPSTTRRFIVLLLATGVVLLLIGGAIKAWRTYQAAQSLLAAQSDAEALLAGGLTSIDPDEAAELVYGVRSDIVTLRDETAFLMPLTPYLGWLPRVGPLAVAAPQLMEMADAGSAAAAYAFRGLEPGLSLLQNESASQSEQIPALLTILNAAKPDLAAAGQAMERTVAARNGLDNVDALPWRVRTLLQQVDEWLPIGQDSLQIALVLPELLGQNGPRRYLILAQNSDELRPTGGFISGAGLLKVENGRIVSLDFMDANLVDAWEDEFTGGGLTKPYDTPPQPLQDFMLLDLFLFRDANFWPDFPQSATQAMALYSYGRDVPMPDGAIAVDQEFLRRLVAATGPLTLDDDNAYQITSANLINSLQQSWSLEEGVRTRKSFLGTFAEAIQAQVVDNFSALDLPTLARNLVSALDEKHLQIHVRDPQIEAVLSALGWNGRVSPEPSQDFLMVVDTNVGYNKANLLVERSVDYAVELATSGTAVAELDVTHIHTGPADDEACYQGTLQEYVNRAGYRELADKCYWNYLRVYVPAGSQLIEGPQHLVPAATWYGDRDWQEPTQRLEELPGLVTFSNFMLLPKAQQVTSTLRYNLPIVTTRVTDGTQIYQLRVNKQAGTLAHPFSLQVTLPPGSQFISATPLPTAQDGRVLTFTLELAGDTHFALHFR